MHRAIRAIGSGIVDAYGELFPVVGMNVIWLLLSTPIIAVEFFIVIFGVGSLSAEEEMRTALTTWFGIFVAVVLVIGPNPAAAGIHFWANRLVSDERVEFAHFWEGLRTYWWRATKLLCIGAAGYVLLFVNAFFYLRSDVLALQIFGVAWLYGIYFWSSMLIYQMPLLIEQQDKRLRLVLRNSLFLALANFLETLILLVVCTVLVVLSLGITLLIALLTGSVVALIMARALNLLLERHRPPLVPDTPQQA